MAKIKAEHERNLTQIKRELYSMALRMMEIYSELDNHSLDLSADFKAMVKISIQIDRAADSIKAIA